MNELMNAILKCPEIIKEIYGDVAKPGAQQAGKALGTVLGFGNTILYPMALANEKTRISLEKNFEKYRKKMKDIPDEEICEVSPEVGVPIAEKLAYVTNDELSDMYVELLAKASQKKTAKAAHPSFVNIINNLSPDEAILLKFLQEKEDIAFIETRWDYTNSTQYVALDSMTAKIPCLKEMSFSENFAAYISNLNGLGIVDITTGRSLPDEKEYKLLEEYAEKKHLKRGLDLDEGKIAFKRGIIMINPYGELFIDGCFFNNKKEK
jgi:hypothetical protein